MQSSTRRQWLIGSAVSTALSRFARAVASTEPHQSGYARPTSKQPLDLSDFQPRSMLHVPETHVPRAKFPVIDIHTHLGWSKKWEQGIPISEEVEFFVPAELLLPEIGRAHV